MDDVIARGHIARMFALAFDEIRHVLIVKLVDNLPRGHMQPTVEGINFIVAVDVNDEFARIAQMKMDAVFIGGFNEEAGSKCPKVGVKTVHSRIEIRLMQNGLHDLCGEVKPNVKTFRDFGGVTLQNETEPGADWTGHAPMKSGGHCPQSENAGGVHEFGVDGIRPQVIIAGRVIPIAARSEEPRDFAVDFGEARSFESELFVSRLQACGVEGHFFLANLKRLAQTPRGPMPAAGSAGSAFLTQG